MDGYSAFRPLDYRFGGIIIVLRTIINGEFKNACQEIRLEIKLSSLLKNDQNMLNLSSSKFVWKLY